MKSFLYRLRGAPRIHRTPEIAGMGQGCSGPWITVSKVGEEDQEMTTLISKKERVWTRLLQKWQEGLKGKERALFMGLSDSEWQGPRTHSGCQGFKGWGTRKTTVALTGQTRLKRETSLQGRRLSSF